jgi:hypothetical protein
VYAVTRATLIRGVCSLCRKDVCGSGADEFEALGNAEASHHAETWCRGEPTEIKKGVRQSNGREVFCRCEGGCDFCVQEITSFASAFRYFRQAGISMEDAAARARRFVGEDAEAQARRFAYGVKRFSPCGCPEERHALGLPCPPAFARAGRRNLRDGAEVNDFYQGFLARQKADKEKTTRMVGEAIWNFQCISMPGTFCPPWCRGCFAKALWRKWWDSTPAGMARAEAAREAAIAGMIERMNAEMDAILIEVCNT